MPHFARVQNGKVKQVIVAEQSFINSGILGDSKEWIQTSYNTRGGVHYDPITNQPDEGIPLRKNFAMVGYIYDSIRDAFIPPQPYPSWLLNETSCQWDPPVPYPIDGQDYDWNELTEQWLVRINI